MSITSTRDKVRLLIGDTDSDAPLFQDDELDFFLGQNGDSERLAAADACEAAATKFARAYDFSTDGQSFSRSQMSKMYADRAKRLRSQSASIGTIPVTRVDGYSDDIAADEVGVTNANPRRRYYGAEDALP